MVYFYTTFSDGDINYLFISFKIVDNEIINKQTKTIHCIY